MEEQPLRAVSSTEYSPFTWVIVAGLLVLGAVIGIGSLGLMSLNEQAQQATGSQSAPSSR